LPLIFLIGVALTNTFGRMIGSQRQGWALLAVMGVLFAAGIAGVYAVEAEGNPAFAALNVDQSAGPLQAGGNMEGKEVRFGIAASALFATVTTDSSSGAVNAMHDSFMPLAGGLLMVNMMLDEVIVGGVGLAGLGNNGPHGLSEILYAYTSAAATNGSAFAGLNTNTPFYNLTLALAMFIGRFFIIVPVLAIAGSLAAKPVIPAGNGTLPTSGGLFVGPLVSVIVIVGGLTFLPALALGPIAEHFAMRAGAHY
jgi:K+-transporting ATPase ATPase A chain